MAERARKKVLLIGWDGADWEHIHPLLDDPQFDHIAQVLHTAWSHNETRTLLAYHLSSDHNITESQAYAHMTRTVVPLGWPMPGTSGPSSTCTITSDPSAPWWTT